MSKLKYYDGANWKVVNGQITGDTLPIGSIVPYGSENAPTGWLVCDGLTVSRTTYAELFSAIGTTFGAGDGSTTFNLPNLKGRVPVGQDVSDSNFNDIGETGGSKYIQDHYHEYKYGQTAGGDGSGLAFSSTIGTQPNKAAITNVKGVLTGNAGNLQPYQVVCYIIKAKQSAGVVANVSKTYSTSEDDTYSCDFINGEELFNGTETGEVTLSKSTANYRYIEIIYTGADGDYGSTGKIPVIQNNKIAIMTHSFRDNEATLCMWLSTLLINGNKLTPQTNKWAYTNTNGTIGFGAGNYVNVKKVIGYK